MSTPLAALAWEFWGRHRLGLAGVATLVTSFAAYGAIVPMTDLFASVSTIWFAMGLAYVVGVFAYGFEGRLETAESGFPSRRFVLPVRTWVLVGWLVVQGMAVAVGLWCVQSPRLFQTPDARLLSRAAAIARQFASALVQSGVVATWTSRIWDTSAVLATDSALGSMLHALAGYDAQPPGLQVLFYVGAQPLSSA